jgi:hypothetical protein
MENLGLYICITAALILIVGRIVYDWQEKRHEDMMAQMMDEVAQAKALAAAANREEPAKIDEQSFKTRDKFLEMLKKMGCPYELGEGDDTRIFFMFQGENMFAEARNDSVWLHIFDPCWKRVSLTDIDEMSRLRKAINIINYTSMTTVVFSINEEDQSIDVHSRCILPVLPQMPRLEDYLNSAFTSFFDAHQELENEMNILREKEGNVAS